MENPRKTGSILGANPWENAFKRFDEETFFTQLHEQVKNKSYFHQYNGFKKTVSALSYVISFAGALTSGYASYWLAKWAGAPIWAAVAIGGIILFFLERLKRTSSEELWRIYFFKGYFAPGWAVLSLALLGIGLFTSSFGAKEGAKDFAPIANLISSDSTAQQYRERVAALEGENTTLSRQRNHLGEIFWPAQRQMAKNKETIAQYEAKILALDEKLSLANDGIKGEHQANVAFASHIFMIVQLIMELAFEFCIGWIWYFYYRSYVERTKTKQGASAEEETEPPVPVPPAVGVTPDPLRQASPSPPLPSSNGHYPTASYERNTRPIGFHSPAGESITQEQEFPPEQTCTDVYTEGETRYDDRHTVLHTYQRGGRTYQTPYTENQILSRINQYERDIAEAEAKNLAPEILENRRHWHQYWQGKLAELHAKQVNK
jgi:hypothetical protein